MSVREQFAEGPARDTLRFVPEPFGLSTAFPTASDLAAQTPAGSLHAVLKRTLDLLVAVPMLVLVSPLLLAMALLIRFDSAGPVIFRQTRLGLGGRPFTILKFRTMHVAEEGASVVQASRNDARITRAGSLMRTSSLDELPQLINVIKGEMSLVGPRPHAVAHDTIYTALIENYEQRQSVKPGITGWAQVNGLRGGTPTLDLMRRRVELDIWYARNASFALDIGILLRTPLEMLRHRNAY